jgi:biotin-dependent carboxylase-like uncharacterized protein
MLMPIITVLNATPCTTVQDLGRPGHAHTGLPASGPADIVSHRVANALVGNGPFAAALECTVLAPDLRVDEPALVCIAGGSTPSARIEPADPNRPHRPLKPGMPALLAAHDTVRLGPITHGVRATLAIAGGIRTPVTLGSRAAHASTGIGGRPLARNDTLPFGSYTPGLLVSAMDPGLARRVADEIGRRAIRLIPHPDADSSMLEAFLASSFTVDARSDRTGTRLAQSTGPAIIPASAESGDRRPSQAVLPGTIQIPSPERPIVLGPDHPTVGGYPVLATVIAADLPALAQARQGETLTFAPVTREQSIEALHDQRRLIDAVPRARVPVHVLCDTGEAEEGAPRDAERAMLPYVSAAAIACGGHAGDERSMREAVAGALAHGCTIGAHPSFPDRAGFGRRALAIPGDITLDELLGSVRDQLAALQAHL